MAKGEAPLRRIDLHGGDTDIERHPIDAGNAVIREQAFHGAETAGDDGQAAGEFFHQGGRANDRLGIAVDAADSAEAAVAEADVVCVITNSREPVLDGAALCDGTHVNAAGSNSWMRHELDEAAVRRAALVVVDDLADAKIESGDLIWAAERRAFRWERAVELRDIVSGRVAGR